MAAAGSTLPETILYKRPMPKILVKNLPTSVNIFGERVKFNQTTQRGGRKKNDDIFDMSGVNVPSVSKPFENAILLDDFDRLYLAWIDKAAGGNKDNRKKNIRNLFRAVFGSKVIDSDSNKIYNRFEWFYIKMKSKGKKGSLDPKDKLPCAGSELFDDFKKTLEFRANSLFYEAKSASQIFNSGETDGLTSNGFTAQKKAQYTGIINLINRMDNNPDCFDYNNDTSLTTEDIEKRSPEQTRDDSLLRRMICNVKDSTIADVKKTEIIQELKRLSGIVFDENNCPRPPPEPLLRPPMRGGGVGEPGPDTALLILSLSTDGLKFKPYLEKTRAAIDDIGSCKLTMEALRTLLTSMDEVSASLMPHEGEGAAPRVGLRLESIDSGPLAAIDEAVDTHFDETEKSVLKSMAVPIFIVPGLDGVPYATLSDTDGVSVGALLFMFLVALCDCSGADIDGSSPGFEDTLQKEATT